MSKRNLYRRIKRARSKDIITAQEARDLRKVAIDNPKFATDYLKTRYEISNW